MAPAGPRKSRTEFDVYELRNSCVLEAFQWRQLARSLNEPAKTIDRECRGAFGTQKLAGFNLFASGFREAVKHMIDGNSG